MNFEEQFPGLKGHDEDTSEPYLIISCKTLQKHCLDKQKVKETWNKTKQMIDGHWDVFEFFEEDLGLK